MFLNTTYQTKEQTELIESIVGKRISVLEAIKMKGIGSRRMIISETSNEIKIKLRKFRDINYGNIELRPKGILVHISCGVNNYTWCIPAFRLAIFHTEKLSIHSEGNYISFKGKALLENKKFIKKLLNHKIKSSESAC